MKKNLSIKKQVTEETFAFFKALWDELRIKKCWGCGRYLGKEPKSYMFDHALEKSKYPELRLEKENIFICCFECHSKKTNGNPVENHKKFIEKVKQLYNID